MTISEQSTPQPTAPTHHVLVVLCAGGTILILWHLLRYSSYGFDFTDESFYFVWISNPFIYDFSRTQFGFIYHPLYSLLGGNIADLRRSNILITFVLAWCLVYVFLSSLAPLLRNARIVLLTVAAGLATTVLILFSSWLLTPSYNSLALQALLICAIGLILAEKSAHLRSIIGWVLIGVGGWMAFMAKPSTALALAVGTLFYLLMSKKFSVRRLLVAIASALGLILLSAILIDGSLWGFVRRLQIGMEIGQTLTDKLSDIARIDTFSLDSRLKYSSLFVSILLFIAILSIWQKKKKWSFIAALASIAFFITTVLLSLGEVPWSPGFGSFEGLFSFSLVYATVIGALVLGRFEALKRISSQQWAIAGIFLAMPHIYAFGTGNNYWVTGSNAAIFWLLAALTLFGSMSRECRSCFFILPIALAAQSVTAVLIQTGFEQPYRQPQPIRLNDTKVEVGPGKSVLRLSSGYAAYLNDVLTIAQKSGFKAGTPVIDLSGQSPGVLFALGAEGIGHPWTLGGYKGSFSFLMAGLSRFSCNEIANAWVLLEPNGPRSISSEALSKFGAVFPAAYSRVGAWNTAKGAGGYEASRVQELYRPDRPHETFMACNSFRSKTEEMRN